MSYCGYPLPALRAQTKEDTAMRRAWLAVETFAEKEFYLDEALVQFHGNGFAF